MNKFGKMYFFATSAALLGAIFWGTLYCYSLSKKSAGQIESVQPKIEAANSSEPISFLFFGDLMIDRNVGEKIKKKGIDWLFEKIRANEKLNENIVMANLEGAVTNQGKHYNPVFAYDFAFNPELIKKIKGYGFNTFAIANNHLTDQGLIGYEETKKNLSDLNLNYFGCPDKQTGDCSVKNINSGNKKIAMLAYSMVYGTLDEKKIIEQIKAADTESDLVIINIHWGTEYQQKHNLIQEKLAHAMIDNGADIVIGHHPHVIQDMEIYKDKPIFYSLGNFIFDQYFSKETQQGLAIKGNWQNNKLQLDLMPFQSSSSQPQFMEGDKKNTLLKWLAENSKVDEKFKQQIKNGNLSLIHN